MATRAQGEGGPGAPEVAGLSYTDAGAELDAIIQEFESGVVDVDRLVERLKRATDIVDELDRRLRRTRMAVEELVPRLEAVGRHEAGTDRLDDGDAEPGDSPDTDGEGPDPQGLF